jgi:hypothetical protein
MVHNVENEQKAIQKIEEKRFILASVRTLACAVAVVEDVDEQTDEWIGLRTWIVTVKHHV